MIYYKMKCINDNYIKNKQLIFALTLRNIINKISIVKF